MARELFDQAQPYSEKAKRFADAFRGCDEWTVPPRKRRRPAHGVYDIGDRRQGPVDLDFREAA